jgi:hypothetical protein
MVTGVEGLNYLDNLSYVLGAIDHGLTYACVQIEAKNTRALGAWAPPRYTYFSVASIRTRWSGRRGRLSLDSL